jgi:hypothetical protein
MGDEAGFSLFPSMTGNHVTPMCDQQRPGCIGIVCQRHPVVMCRVGPERRLKRLDARQRYS